MLEISVRLWRNHQEQNWSVEINGKCYKAVSIESINELVKRALTEAEESMVESGSRRLQ